MRREKVQGLPGESKGAKGGKQVWGTSESTLEKLQGQHVLIAERLLHPATTLPPWELPKEGCCLWRSLESHSFRAHLGQPAETYAGDSGGESGGGRRTQRGPGP